MAVGRITGPLLSKNLLRDGVDLAFETDLLYLDVTNGRIGVKTSSPGYDLDISGNARIVGVTQLGNLTVSTTATGTLIQETAGNVIIQAPADQTVIIKNNTEIQGNFHADGNISATGNVQIGNATGSDVVSILAEVASDIIPQRPDNYNLGSADKSWANAYVDNIIASAIAAPAGQEINIGTPPGQDVNVRPITAPTININGNVRVWGDTPLGTGPVVSNVLYVSMDGSDTNDGRGADASRACRTISGAVKSPYYKEGTSIKVAPGHYYENNPIQLKPYTSVIGSDLRTTSIEPINKTQDLFWLQSGNYLAQMQFANGQSGLLPGPGYKPGTNRGAFCTAFPPNFGGQKIDLYYSPYIQNCTNQSGPWLNDGTMFVPNQTVQVPTAVGTATWVANTTTMLVTLSEGSLRVGDSINIGPKPQDYVNARTLLLANKQFIQEQVLAYIDQQSYVTYDTTACIRDTGLIVDSIAIDLLYDDNGYTQSNFAGLQYWAQDGYVNGIASELTTTTAAINYISSLAQQVVQNIPVASPYQFTVTQITNAFTATITEANAIASDFNVILNILNSGTVGVTDIIVPNGIDVLSTEAQYAYDLLQANKTFLQAEAVAYVNYNNIGFTYDQELCYRDVGYMVDSVSFDTLYGGNRQAVQSGVYYYGFSTSTSVISTEKPQATAAYKRIRNIIPSLLTNQLVTKTVGNTATQVTNLPVATTASSTLTSVMLNKIISIINSGTSVADAPTPIGLTRNNDADLEKAVDIILANKQFIQEEAIAYVNYLYSIGEFNSTFVYNRAKCQRDVGIILENIAYDMTFGGNSKSVESGLAYWNGVTSVISTEIPQTADAIGYINTLSQAVISNTSATNLLGIYQTAPQVINTGLDNGASAGPIISKLIDIVKDIVVNGPTVAPTVQVGDGPDWGSVSAEVLLQTNRAFIQKEVVDWVNLTYPNFVYNQELCYRDTGLIIDAISQDIILNANAKTIEAGKTYWTNNKSVIANAVYGNVNQVTETIAALNRAEEVCLKVIANNTVTTSGFTFNPVRCSRDTGLIVDALAQDLLFGGSSQSTFAGIQYWNHGNYVGKIASELTTTTGAINYVSSIAQEIVQNITSGTRYQSTITQNISLPSGSPNESAAIAANFSLITNIINSGTTGITDAIVPNSLNASTTPAVQNAFDLLIANLDYMKAEAIAWVEANKSGQYDEVKCSRDTGLIVDSIIADLVFPTQSNSQATFAGLQYWNQNGYIGEIAGELTTTTAAINYVKELTSKIVVNDTSGIRYSTGTQVTALPSASPAEAIIINNEFDLIVNIINSGTAGVTDLVVSTGIAASTSTDVQNAFDLIQANKEYIINEAVAFVEATKTGGFEYDQAKCARDVGFMIDSVSVDLLYGGNRQAIQSGVYYYDFNASSSAVPNEIPQVIAAFRFIETLSRDLVLGKVVVPLQTSVPQVTNLPSASSAVVPALSSSAGRITSIIERGPSVVGIKEPISITKTSDANTLNAAEILRANRAFIQAETIAYTNQFLIFQYDAELCARDVGYIVNSVAFDLLYGGNRQSVQSGVYYWGYNNVSTSIPAEQVASTLAYQYMKSLIEDIIVLKEISTATLYQNTVTQVINLPTGTVVEADKVAANIDLITNIINDGPDIVTEKSPIGLIPINNAFVRNAAELLIANRAFLQAEVNAYVNATQVQNTQVFLPFYDRGVQATLSVERNFDVLKNIIVNGPSAAPIMTQGNGIFLKNGLMISDVKVAPVITSITTVTSGVYQIDLDQSTVGFGDDQVLYFGNTAVYPLQDNDVPDRWSQRRVNPIGSMGGSLVDGGVISDRSPITSFVYDAFTQVNQGGEGIKITNNGYAQLVSVFTIFCSNAVTVENGGICSITNSNSNFGDICLTAKGYGRREFSGYVKNPPVLPYFPIGFYPQESRVQVYIADPDLRPHIGLVMEVEPPAGYINNQGFPGFLGGNTTLATLSTGSITITGIDTTGIVIGQALYVRDQYGRQVDDYGEPYVTPGTIVSDVAYQSIILNYPLNSGGGDPNNSNYFNIYTCGNAYYTVLSSETAPDPIEPGTLLLPNSQNIQEAGSIEYLNTISQLIIANQPVTPTQSLSSQVFDYSLAGGSGAGSFVSNELNIISSILTNGINSAPEITRTGTLPSGAGSAASLLNKNKEFIQDEVITYVNNTYFNFNYNKAKCYRDTGLIVDAIAQDLLHNTSSQSTFAGLQYWNQDGYTGNIQNEITTTTSAITYAKTLSQEIVQNIVGTRYSSWSQNISLPPAGVDEANMVGSDYDVILNILTTGTSGVTDIIVPNSLTTSSTATVFNAYNLLQANRTYIQQEVLDYLNAAHPGFTFNTSTCYRDVGYIVDSISYDLLYGGNRQAVQSGVYYYGFSSTSTAIAGEIPQTIDAYNFINSLTQKIVLGQPVETTYQSTVTQITNLTTGTTAEVAILTSKINTITDIILNGPSVAQPATPIPLAASTDTNVIAAATILEANRAFIQAETIAYIDQKYLNYDQGKCRRDVGFLVDALVYDLEKGGNYNAVIAGKSYYAQTGTHHLVLIEESVTDPGLFPDGAIVTYYQRSYMSASGYLFEYVGAGANYGALPQRGVADPVQSKEVVQLNNGKVFFTSTDQNGDFRIGPGLVISQATGVLSGRTFTKSLFANLTPFILAIEGGF